ncbi:MAG: acetylornithine/succinylornithine family transaminase [Bacteroidota bacterium]
MPSLTEQEHNLFFQTYKRLPLDIVQGEGCILTDRNGKQYLDFFGGLAVNALGYRHPRILEAIRVQSERYIHLSNFFIQEPQVRLAEKLIAASGFKKLFLTNSGTEAVEGAIKLARKWGKGKGKSTLYGLSNSFHGRTMGALSLTERAKYREGYEPFLPNTDHIRFNDVEDLRAKINAQTLGVILEAIQGEGGVNIVSQEFCEELKALRQRHGFLIIADEIQSGIGRTGKFFGFQHIGLNPDIVVVAKAIGGGLPLGAFLGTEATAGALTYGVHGTTFGGNPVACAAGVVVLEEVVEKGLMQRAQEIGERLRKAFTEMKSHYPERIRDVRGYGCMMGVELAGDGQPIADELMNQGVLVNCTNTKVLRFLPPYIATDEQCDIVAAKLAVVFDGA